jgi:fructokinase
VRKSQALYGAIEAGGTKFVCAVGRTPDHILQEHVIPTTQPLEAARLERNGLELDGPLILAETSPAETVSASGIRTQAEQLSVEQLGRRRSAVLAETFS